MDWFSGLGRRVLQAYQDGLVMNCPAHRECAMAASKRLSSNTSAPQIAARDSASALGQVGGIQDETAFTLGQGPIVRH